MRLELLPGTLSWDLAVNNLKTMIKPLGLGLMLLGFVWTVYQVGVAFTSYQHGQWIWRSKNLPAGEWISRSEAISAMRETSLDLNRQQRFVLIPASVMILGGIMTYVAKPGRSRSPAGRSGGREG